MQSLCGERGIPNLQVYVLTKKVENDIAAWAGVENALGDYMAVIDPTAMADPTIDDIHALPSLLVASMEGADVVPLVLLVLGEYVLHMARLVANARNVIHISASRLSHSILARRASLARDITIRAQIVEKLLIIGLARVVFTIAIIPR